MHSDSIGARGCGPAMYMYDHRGVIAMMLKLYEVRRLMPCRVEESARTASHVIWHCVGSHGGGAASRDFTTKPAGCKQRIGRHLV